VDAEFEWMVQREDFEGGSVHVQLADATDSAAFDAAAADYGVVTPDGEDDTFRYVSWDDAVAVGDVLDALVASGTVAWAEPAWIEKPAWW
jgi:hypothetical protein